MADATNLGFGATQSTGNPYLQDAIDLASRDLVNNYNRTVLPAQNAAALRSGSFGNTGLDEMNMAQQQQLQTSLGDLSSKLRFNDYTDTRNFNEGQRQFDLGYGRTLFNDAYSQQQQQLQNGLGLLSSLGGYNQNDINNANTLQNTPLNYWQQFSQGANSIGQGYGTSTGTQGTTSNPFMSALGGAQLGSQFGKWWEQNSGGGGITGTGGGNAGPYSTGPTLNNNFGGSPSYFGSPGFL